MRNTLFIILFFFVSRSVTGQVVDTNLSVPINKDEILKIIKDEKLLKDVQNSREYKKGTLLPQVYDEMKVKAIIIDEQEKEMMIKKQEEILSRKALIVEIIETDEGDNKKRLINGPSQFDSRIEIRNLNPLIKWQQQVLTNERSVGIIIEKDMIHQVTDSIYQLDISSTLGSLYNLCPGEPFREQPVVGVGTAFIIDEQIMITASHVFTRPIENYVVVFGFELVNQAGAYEAFISAKDIYYPREVSYHYEDTDVTVFKIDRPSDNPALKWSNSLTVPGNASVYMIGHPMGLPKKAAFNARMKSNQDPLFFYTSLDAFQGNSGSPVFRLDTHEVIGILVSGELDYKWNGSCNASTLCGIPYCNGEKVIRIEEIMKELIQK